MRNSPDTRFVPSMLITKASNDSYQLTARSQTKTGYGMIDSASWAAGIIAIGADSDCAFLSGMSLESAKESWLVAEAVSIGASASRLSVFA